jgi:glucose/arabinose dehydrogenase
MTRSSWTARALGAVARLLPLLTLAATTPASAQPRLDAPPPVVSRVAKPESVAFTPARLRALRVPAGFRVAVFAEGAGNARMMAVADDGTVYLTRPKSGDVVALRDRDGDGRADDMRPVVTGLPHVHGIALRAGRLYLATPTQVHVADRAPDGTVGAPRVLSNDLPDGGQHPNRTLAFGPDGMLYVSVGSTCNACLEPNPENATMLRMRPEGGPRTIFAKGLRNTVGFGWHPATGELWGMDNGRDEHGDDFPPEELNRITETADYGWPFCLADRVPDRQQFPNPPGGLTHEQYCARTTGPAARYTAHSAPMALAFYTGQQFPAAYQGDAFVALRGSWNRVPASGHSVVRVRFANGRPVRIEEFLTGFLTTGGRQRFARPAGVAVARDGALLVSDDMNGVIYRVSHQAGGGSPGR